MSPVPDSTWAAFTAWLFAQGPALVVLVLACVLLVVALRKLFDLRERDRTEYLKAQAEGMAALTRAMESNTAMTRDLNESVRDLVVKLAMAGKFAALVLFACAQLACSRTTAMTATTAASSRADTAAQLDVTADQAQQTQATQERHADPVLEIDQRQVHVAATPTRPARDETRTRMRIVGAVDSRSSGTSSQAQQLAAQLGVTATAASSGSSESNTKTDTKAAAGWPWGVVLVVLAGACVAGLGAAAVKYGWGGWLVAQLRRLA